MATKIWTGGTSGVLNLAANWLAGVAPAPGDNLIFRAGTTNFPNASLTSLNLATLGGSLGAVIFEKGWGYGIGSISTPLQFTCTRLDIDSTGLLYIDIQASNIGPQVFGTAQANNGSAGLYLIGSNMATLACQGGTTDVGGSASTVVEARCAGANTKLYLGNLLSLTTAYAMDGGSIIQRCASTTSKARDANITTEEAGAVGTANLFGKSNGYFNSSGLLGILNIEDVDCFADFMGSSESRNATTINWKKGRLRYDPAILTVGTLAGGLAGRVLDGKLS